MKNEMKRREFLQLGLAIGAGLVAAKELLSSQAFAAGKAKAITAKDIHHEGMAATISNYCEHPEKKPNKYCANWKEGHCKTCMFFNSDGSETTFKGHKYAKCQLLTDPKKPQYVLEGAYCASYTKKA
jgi:hypothetical protein